MIAARATHAPLLRHDDQQGEEAQRACLRNPVKVEVSAKYSTVDSLKQHYLFVPAKHKDCYLATVQRARLLHDDGLRAHVRLDA